MGGQGAALIMAPSRRGTRLVILMDISGVVIDEEGRRRKIGKKKVKLNRNLDKYD